MRDVVFKIYSLFRLNEEDYPDTDVAVSAYRKELLNIVTMGMRKVEVRG